MIGKNFREAGEYDMNRSDLEFYGEYVSALEMAETIMLNELSRIMASLTGTERKCPAEHVLSRIKSAESMKEKLERQRYEPNVENAMAVMTDAVGVRVVTHFIGDVYAVKKGITRSDKWSVETVKDYIAFPKKNGYRSLHMIVKIPIGMENCDFIRAEIQLRTIAMDCWASLEHTMKYKKDVKNAELIVSELLRCAEEMASTDLSMQTMREMINSEDGEE